MNERQAGLAPDDDDEAALGESDSDAAACWTCHGEGWGIRGDNWANDDPVNEPDGVVEPCPNCRGSGKAADCWYW